ncbi:hypothetical protein AA13595_0099 [Gluconacetobacter johannae DSM 13595]|nr:hypothetical protein AA13595_0099 [Gluconacetobacter johannae DSM 13595]
MAGYEFLHGNPLLAGWKMPSDSFWLEDVVATGLISAVTGLSLRPLYLLPPIWWGLITLFSCILSCSTKRRSFTSLLPVLVLLVLPPFQDGGAIGFLTLMPYHLGTMAFVLAGLTCIDRFLKNRRAIYAIGISATVFIVCVSDPFGQVCFVMPAVLTAAWMWCRNHDRDVARNLLMLVLAAVVLGMSVAFLRQSLGGFRSAGLPVFFCSLDDFPAHFGMSVRSLLDLFGINFFGLSLWGHQAHHMAIVPLARWASVLPAVMALRSTLRAIANGPAKGRDIQAVDPVAIMMSIGLILTLVAGIFINPLLSHSEEIIRFFSPVLIFGAILAARTGPALSILKSPVLGRMVMVLPVVLSVFALSVEWTVRKESEVAIGLSLPRDRQSIIRALEANHLNFGYANYWHASIITVETGGHIVARPINLLSDGKQQTRIAILAKLCGIEPSGWLRNENWYTKQYLSGNREFFILSGYTDAPQQSAGQTGSSPTDIEQYFDDRFGKAKKIIPLEGATLYVFDSEKLMTCLSHQTGTAALQTSRDSPRPNVMMQ